MKIVETYGLYHYCVTGERDEEAAADLERRLDFISRDYHNRFAADDISDARRAVAEQYGVEITTSSDPKDFEKK